MPNARNDALVASALVGICLAAWLWLIPAFAGTGEQTILPRIAVIMIGCLALAMLAVTLIRLRRPRAGATADGEEDPFLETDGHGEPVALLPIIAVWTIVLTWPEIFGLQLGSAVAVALTFVCLGIVRPLTVAVWTLLPIAILHVIFEIGFGLRIPRGAIVSFITG